MATIIIRVHETGTGKALPIARVHGQYHWGGIVGQGTNGFDGLTDGEGAYGVGVSEYVSADFDFTVDANGYYSDNFQRHVPNITGDYGVDVNLGKMKELPAPGAGVPGVVGTTKDFGRGLSSGQNFVAGLGLPAAALLIVLVIGGVIGLVALAFILR